VAAVTFGVTDPDTTHASSYAVLTLTPAADDLLVVFCSFTGTIEGPAVFAATDDQGGTYTRIASTSRGPATNFLVIFVRNQLVASAVGHIITVTCTGDAATGNVTHVYRVSGMSRVGQGAVRQWARQEQVSSGSTPAPVFQDAPLTGNTILGAVHSATATAPTVIEPSGWTEGADDKHLTPDHGLESCFINSGFTTKTVTWGGTVVAVHCNIVVELDTTVPDGAREFRALATVPVTSFKGRGMGPPILKAQRFDDYSGPAGGDADVTPTTVAAVAAIPTPTVTANADVTPATVAAVASIPGPTVAANADITPTTVAAVAASYTPTVEANANAPPSTVAAVAAVPTPVLAASAEITTTTVAAVVAVPTPSVSTGGDAAVTTTTVSAVAAVPTPAITANANVAPSTVIAFAALPASAGWDDEWGYGWGEGIAVAATAAITTTTVTAVAAVPTPTVDVVANPAITTTTVAAVASVPVPTTSGDANVLLSPANLTATPISSTQIDLDWDDLAGASTYAIERDDTVIVSAHVGSSYSDTGLVASTQYRYRVRGNL